MKQSVENVQLNQIMPTCFTKLFANVSGGTGSYIYEWTKVGTLSSIGSSNSLDVTQNCGVSINYNLKVTDTNLSTVSQPITINSNSCSEPFYLSNIEGFSGFNNNYSYWINAEGGSNDFKYQWGVGTNINSIIYLNPLYNYSQVPRILTNSTTTQANMMRPICDATFFKI